MLHFLNKARKIAAALGAPLPNPRWPPAAGGSAQTPELLFPSPVALAFSKTIAALNVVTVKKEQK